MTTILGHGVYTFPEAAKLTKLKRARVWEWFRGRSSVSSRKPIFFGDYEPVGGDYAISFHDLIDLFVAGQLRDHGVSLQTLRRVYERMRIELKTTHPFCRKELLSDGRIVFMRGLDHEGQEELAEVLTRQRVFPQILLPFLQKIDYDKATILARRWHIADLVVVDPAMCFGKPVVEPAGITTAVLADAYHANEEDAELVGDWYNIHPDYVLAAVTFEGSMAA
ncbi:MAG TPA: DUF433 domain-containing protein [Gemmataceae bacterium]|jgi:uncharacterized protein (DUF433 family)|nr:DUF433 domain-containing protein [Gemmataceae bacterium]